MRPTVPYVHAYFRVVGRIRLALAATSCQRSRRRGSAVTPSPRPHQAVCSPRREHPHRSHPRSLCRSVRAPHAHESMRPQAPFAGGSVASSSIARPDHRTRHQAVGRPARFPQAHDQLQRPGVAVALHSGRRLRLLRSGSAAFSSPRSCHAEAVRLFGCGDTSAPRTSRFGELPSVHRGPPRAVKAVVRVLPRSKWEERDEPSQLRSRRRSC